MNGTAEPVILLTFIEDDFQSPETNRKKKNPDIVDSASTGGLDPPAFLGKGRRIGDQPAGQEKRKQTDRVY